MGEDGSSSDASEGKPSPTSIPETKLGDSWGNFDSEFARLSTGRIKGASGDKVKSKVMSFPSKKAKKLKKKQKQKPREKTREQTLPDFLDFNPINDETPTPATNPEDSSFLNDIFSNYSSKPQSNGAYGAVSKSPF